MKIFKQLLAFSAAVLTALNIPCQIFADKDEQIEVIPETGDVLVTVNTDKNRHRISPYIYGINDTGDIRNISPTVIKQIGSDLTAYNWETNFSNSGAKGQFANDISLVVDYPSYKWTSPALYAEKLMSRSRSGRIPVRLLTLPMLGYAAKDSMGVVQGDEHSKETRWCKVELSKGDTYLNLPDTTDDTVYVDEYLSYMINRFGTSAEGGINGYFLDSEPDKWKENFSVLEPEPLTFESLVGRSAALAGTVKTMDSNAFVFGPSLSDLHGCVNLNDPSSWGDAEKDYSWFIDYYLSGMRAESEKAGQRLLDVLDVHYYTEALTPMGVSLRTSDDVFSNAYRMQAVRTLWDSDYAENSMTVMMYNQFTPVIPMLQASIKMYYPNTRLSFSEYDFGGGSNMSGAVAQADVIGTFAAEDVYLACLAPSSKDFSFQKAALNLYTNYDGKGNGFGNTLVMSDNENDSMSSVYASVDESAPENLKIIIINKQIANPKNFDIRIDSAEHSYSLEQVYAIDSESAKIVKQDMDCFEYSQNSISFTADTVSVYLLVLNGTKKAETEDTDSFWGTETSEDDPLSADTEVPVSENTGTEPPKPTEEDDPDATLENLYDDTVPDLTVDTTDIPEVTKAPEEVTSAESSVSLTVTETTEITPPVSPAEEPPVPTALKVVVSAMCLTVFAGVIYILFFDKK